MYRKLPTAPDNAFQWRPESELAFDPMAPTVPYLYATLSAPCWFAFAGRDQLSPTAPPAEGRAQLDYSRHQHTDIYMQAYYSLRQ
jgi:hypothetical protein